MRETPAEVFHGRVAELDLLAEALRDAVAGGASAVLLGGDAGVGKTRLVSEFGRTATSGGAVVLSGRALDIADAPPFWPVVSALREQSRSRGALGRECAAALSRLDRADGPAGRVEMLGELAAVVERAARRAPVVLVVDDLHRADRSTRDLFAYLLAALSSSPVLLVGTYRDDPAGGVPVDLLGLTGELRRHRGVRFARVEPLPRHELAELVARWAPERHDVEDLVWRHSGGNVFLARETVRAVLDGDPHGVPQSVRELVRAGAAGLSAAATAVVRAVAAGVGEVEHALLAAVVDVDGAELAAAVREAADAGFVVVAGADGYTLRHGLMTEVVSADLLPAERVELHGRYATALHGGHRVPGSAARLAHHWQLAGRPDEALEATLDAAQEAERLRGYAEAHRHWLRAATLPVPAAVRDRSRYLERAAAAAALAGDHGSAVALLAERLGEPDAPSGTEQAVLRSRLGRYLGAAGQLTEAEGAHRRAVATLPADDDPDDTAVAARAEVLAGYAAALLDRADYAGARTVAEEALVAARRVGEPRALASVLATLGFGAAHSRDGTAGLDALTEAVAVAEAGGDPETLGECLARRAELLTGPLNALDGGVAAARAGAERMAGLGLGRTASVSLRVVAANGLFRAGAWDEAEQEVATAWAAAPSGAQMLELRLARARLRMGRGDLDGSDVDLTAAELVAGSTGLPKQRLPLLILRAGLEMWRGNPELAFAHVGKGLDVVESGIDDVFAVAPLLWHGARAHAQAVLAGRPPDASGLRRLRRHRRDLVERGERSAPALRGVIASYEAMCSAEDARTTPGADPDTWRGVADLLDGLGQPYPGSYARLRSAEALLSGRRTEDGAADLRRAADLAAGLRAGPLLTEIAEVAHRARIEVPALAAVGAVGHAPVAVDGPLARLTDREREVLEVLADGATNKQIAARLFITPKTVGAHLASVFAKLDVTNRTSAAAVLREHRADI